MLHLRYPKFVIFLFIAISIAGAVLAIQRLSFRFNFEDFFPKGDPELKFYYEFKERFEPDDNFLLIALHRKDGIFEEKFLKEIKDFTQKAADLEIEISDSSLSNWKYGENLFNSNTKNKFKAKPVQQAQSILQFEFPIKTPFAFTTIPAIHLDEPDRYESDKKRIMSDERLVNNFISEDAKTTIVILKTVDNIQQEVAEKMVQSLKSLLKKYSFEEYHMLGRAYFQTELVKMQIYEFIISAIVAFVLVFFVMWLIFRRFWGVVVSISSIALGLLVFVA